jgi:hypothetical protein
MKKLIFILVTGLFLAMINSCGIIDDKESKVHDFLGQKVSSESQGTIKLNNLKKTNGYDQEFMGMKMYILEWSADISVQSEIWKAGNNLEGYWQNFSVTVEKPGFWDAYASVNMPKHLGIGASVLLTGESKLHKTEKGWIVEELNIKTYQILNEGDLPEDKFIGNWAGDNASYCKFIKTDKGIEYIKTDEKWQDIGDNSFMSYNDGILSGGYTELFSKAAEELIKCNFSFKFVDSSTIISQSNCGIFDGIKYHKK